MKNPNSPASRLKRTLLTRWSAEDYAGAEPRFQINLFAKDVAIFVLLPALAVVFFKSCENAMNAPRKPNPVSRNYNDGYRSNEVHSQIIDFRGGNGSGISGVPKKAPGTLVKVRLLNVVETYSNAPVHAQIVDGGLGRALLGGTLIGDAVADSNYDRINITFKYARDPNREGVAVSMSARALALDGTLGLLADKKESFFTRSAINSVGSTNQDIQGKGSDNGDFKTVLFKALTAGLLQEFGSETQVERNRAQVLTLIPNTEFFAELTDFFPGASR